MLLEVGLLSLLCGVVLTLVVQYLWVKHRLGQLPPLPPPVKDQNPKIQLPKALKKHDWEDLSKQKEPCLWFNLITHFLFQELRDTQEVRRWLMKKMNLEFAELLQTLSGKFVDNIMVREFSVGNNFPILNNVSVRNVSMGRDGMEELDLGVDVDYTGGFQLAIDIQLLFNKSAYLSVTVKRLKGPARLQLTRTPYTHWSFSFTEDPEVEFDVESQFEGKGLPSITNFIINQLRRSIRKKHTLPNFKMRFKPFFLQPSVPRPLHEFRVGEQNISVGRLKVTVIQCSRLLKTPQDAKIYCTMSVDPLEWKELVTLKRQVWIIHDMDVIRGQGQPIGMTFREENLPDRFDLAVVVDSVSPDSPADRAEIKKNDRLIAVGTSKITSSKQAAKLMKNAGERFNIRLERPQVKMSQDVKFYEESVSYKESETDMGDFAQPSEEGEEYVHISLKTSSDSQESSPARSVKSEKGSSSSLSLPAQSELRQRSKTSISSSAEGSPIKLTQRKSDPRLGQGEVPPREGSPRRDRAESDPGIAFKPTGEDVDSVYSLDVESDSDDDQVSSQYDNVQKIPEVPACTDPKWNKDVTFDLGEQQRYLNICVRCKIPEKLDKSDRLIKAMRDLLLGYVSLPLSDVTLYCLMTMQGDAQQTLYLLPGDMKAGASRPKADKWANHAGYEPQLCYGDIKLGFHFSPMLLLEMERAQMTQYAVNPEVVECVSGKEVGSEERVPDAGSTSKLPTEGLHNLLLTQFQSATYCNFCGKKIWMKTALRCARCSMICHKKCGEKCQNDSLCTKEGPKIRRNPSEKWQTPVTVRKKPSEETRTGRLLSKFRNRDNQSTPSLAPKLEQPSKSPSSSPVLGRKDESSSDSEEERNRKLIQDKRKGNNLDESVVTAAKEMGRELFAHLEVEERKQKLDQMVSKLQQEIDQESENKATLSRSIKETTDTSQRRFLESQIAKSDEKTDAMMMLLLHYCAGLQHCLDAEEEGRQKSGQGETTLEEDLSREVTEIAVSHVESEEEGEVEENEGEFEESSCELIPDPSAKPLDIQ